jgi:hypothetical protein
MIAASANHATICRIKLSETLAHQALPAIKSIIMAQMCNPATFIPAQAVAKCDVIHIFCL